jgi:hypothetical protein
MVIHKIEVENIFDYLGKIAGINDLLYLCASMMLIRWVYFYDMSKMINTIKSYPG